MCPQSRRSSHRASVHASWSTTGVLGATALDGLESNESRSGLQRSTAADGPRSTANQAAEFRKDSDSRTLLEEEHRLNGTVCLLAPLGDVRRTEAQKLGSKAGIFMQWTAARSFSKRLSACVTLSAVGSVSQQMRRDDGCRQDVGGVVLRCRRRYSVQQS